jgi:hypothetical protein
MNVKRKLSLAVCVLCGGALLTVGVASAQTTPLPAADSAGAAPAPDFSVDKPKPKTKPTPTPASTSTAKPKKPAEATIAVEVTNSRAVALTQLVGAISGTPDSKKIAGPLAPGKKVVVHLAHDRACLFDLHAVFEDGAVTDAQGVELCKDKKINLVE